MGWKVYFCFLLPHCSKWAPLTYARSVMGVVFSWPWECVHHVKGGGDLVSADFTLSLPLPAHVTTMPCPHPSLFWPLCWLGGASTQSASELQHHTFFLTSAWPSVVQPSAEGFLHWQGCLYSVMPAYFEDRIGQCSIVIASLDNGNRGRRV